MKKWNAIGILTIIVIGMVLMSGCTNTGSTSTAPEATATPQIVNETVLVTPTLTPTISPNSTPAPEPVTSQTQATRDPIIGSWLNGKVFNADGTVGSDGTTIWKVNKNENNSYFVIADVLSPGANNPRDVTSSEWIYNPLSDKINVRGSSQTFARGIPAPKPTSIPTVTPNQTPTTAEPLAVEDGIGSLSIQTGGLGNDVSVFIARQGSNVLPINNVYDLYGNVVEGQTTGYMEVKILPDGNSQTVYLAPGYYIAYLPDKNGALEPEQQSFTINANCHTVITFSGYSYRSGSGGGCGG